MRVITIAPVPPMRRVIVQRCLVTNLEGIGYRINGTVHAQR
jgi:hypothetical protein